MGLTYAQRMWPGVTNQPFIELLDSTLTVVGSFNLDVVRVDQATTPNIAPVMDDRMEPEKTDLDLADGRRHDITHGYRFRVDLYYNLANKYGRNVMVLILDHLKSGLYLKFYPNRGNVEVWHVCKLADQVNIDKHPELYASGYQLEVSLEGVVREPNIGTYKPVFWTDFTAELTIYNAGDTVRDFASVALAYGVNDKPGYFSPDLAQGNPYLPGF